ncbi:hypothetical protein [Glutamicibacter mysorens]|uniref:hypothetical protein n=1 Tax=Glutamicibacter mysorens TaxID=257984 RepID=UPI0020C5FC8F|nr:hypothetical protein [Glutamicibacter mysorens]UTM48478.1 hypothetical protein XH9_06730 [Glutamicibacter mysorens]
MAAAQNCKQLPTEGPRDEANPDKPMSEREPKQLPHGMRMAAYTIKMIAVRDIRVNKSYAAKAAKERDIVQRMFTTPADLNPLQDGVYLQANRKLALGDDT